MEYMFRKAPAPTADLDSELALSEIYMGVKDKDDWDQFKGAVVQTSRTVKQEILANLFLTFLSAMNILRNIFLRFLQLVY